MVEASWGRFLEAGSFPEGSRVSFLSECFEIVKVEGDVRPLTSIFHSQIDGCLVRLKAEITVLEQREHYGVNVTAGSFDWEMKRCGLWQRSLGLE